MEGSMAIVKRTDFPTFGRLQDLGDVRRRMLQMFEEPFGLPVFREAVGWMPSVDISETETDIVLKADMPGMKKEDVDIELENNVLTLKGEKKEEHEEKEKERYLYERSYGSFQRSFTLPSTVDETKVTAEFTEGVLKVTLPKSGQPRGRKIEIGG
jgi:HSP20 family protein